MKHSTKTSPESSNFTFIVALSYKEIMLRLSKIFSNTIPANSTENFSALSASLNDL